MSKFLTLEGPGEYRPLSLLSMLGDEYTLPGHSTAVASKEDNAVAEILRKDAAVWDLWEAKRRRCNDDGCRIQVDREKPQGGSYTDDYGDGGASQSRLTESFVRAAYKQKAKEKTESSAHEKNINYLTTPVNQAQDQSSNRQAPSLFASYGLGALALGEHLGCSCKGKCGCSDLSGFSFKRAFTPPRALRRALARLKPPKIIRKAIRYAGAAHFMVMTGGFAGGKMNKIFGISPSEQKTFNIASKITRVGTIAVATVVTGGALAGAGSGAGAAGTAGTSGGHTAIIGLGKAGMSKTGTSIFGKFLARSAVKQALMKGAKFLMKDTKGKALWAFTGNMAGQLVSSKFSKNSVTPDEYASLPDNQPIPVPPASSGGGGGASSGGGFSGDSSQGVDDNGVAPTKAGSSTIDPGGDSHESIVEGEAERISPEEREQNSSVNPLGWKARVTEDFDNQSIEEASVPHPSANVAAILEDNYDPEVDATDTPLSNAFDEALAQVRGKNVRKINGGKSPRKGSLMRGLFA